MSRVVPEEVWNSLGRQKKSRDQEDPGMNLLRFRISGRRSFGSGPDNHLFSCCGRFECHPWHWSESAENDLFSLRCTQIRNTGRCVDAWADSFCHSSNRSGAAVRLPLQRRTATFSFFLLLFLFCRTAALDASCTFNIECFRDYPNSAGAFLEKFSGT